MFPQTEIDSLAYWNPAIQEYIYIRKSGKWSDPDYCVEVGDAYWVYTEALITISIHGVKPKFPFTALIRTRAGESRVDNFGVPITESAPWNKVSVYNINLTYISYWNGTDWVIYGPQNIDELVFEPGKGYAIRTWQPGAIMFFSNRTHEYEELQQKYDALLANHSQLETEYITLNASYYGLLAAYNDLLDSYNEFQANYTGVVSERDYWKGQADNWKSEYDDNAIEYNLLQANHSDLQDDYNSLQASYNSLQSSYDILNSTYTSVRLDYDKLKPEPDASASDLGTARNLSYVFIITTVVFIATTVYFAVRKPKVKTT